MLPIRCELTRVNNDGHLISITTPLSREVYEKYKQNKYKITGCQNAQRLVRNTRMWGDDIRTYVTLDYWFSHAKQILANVLSTVM